MAVDAIQIANLLAIARTGSFTRAAAEKGMSQPALSNSIALLERRLGVPVLTRSRRGSELTPYGEILVRRAEGLQALLSDAETEVRRRADGVAGPLRIGATPSVIPTLLANTLIDLVADGEPVDIEIIDGLDQTLVPMLRFFDGQGIALHEFLARGVLPGLGTDAPLAAPPKRCRGPRALARLPPAP